MSNFVKPYPPGYEQRILALFTHDPSRSLNRWAQLLGCERKSIYRYKDCLSLPNVYWLFKICELAGCTADWYKEDT